MTDASGWPFGRWPSPSGGAEKRKPCIPHESPSPNLFSPRGDGFITWSLLNILGQATSASLAKDIETRRSYFKSL